MSERHYMPREISKLTRWLKNFAEKLGEHGPALGLKPEEIAAGQADARYAAAALELQQEAARFAKVWTVFKDQTMYGKDPLTDWPHPFTLPATLPPVTKAGVMRRITKLIARLKYMPGYTDSVGEALDVVGVERKLTPADLAELKPVLKLKLVSAGHPIVMWRKKGLTGIVLEVDRADGKGFVFLTFDVEPDYLDNHPLPASGQTAIWTYRGTYRLRDDLVGQRSNETQITVTGTV